MSVTVTAIAAKLGVSPSTVSRALNDHPRISPDTKARVFQALYEMKKESQPRAQCKIIGLFLTEISASPFFTCVASGVHELASEVGAYVLSEKLRRDGMPLPYAFVRQQVDGAVVGGGSISDETIARFTMTEIPVVFIGRYVNQESMKKTYTVMSDNIAGGAMAAQHLIDKGYTDLVVVCPPIMTNYTRDRLVGFSRTATDHGLNVLVLATAVSRPVLGPVIDHIRRSTARGAKVGVFLMSDFVAVRLIRALGERRVRIPDDVGIIGYNGLSLCTEVSPTLSTIDVAKEALGYYAARLICDILSGRVDRPVQVNVQPRLIERESTAGRVQASVSYSSRRA